MLRFTLTLASVSLLAASASANGAYTHVHISQLAHAVLPPGELRALLDEQTHAYECGSLFPDSGYAIGDDYGELAHWEPFLEALVSSRGLDDQVQRGLITEPLAQRRLRPFDALAVAGAVHTDVQISLADVHADENAIG